MAANVRFVVGNPRWISAAFSSEPLINVPLNHLRLIMRISVVFVYDIEQDKASPIGIISTLQSAEFLQVCCHFRNFLSAWN